MLLKVPTLILVVCCYRVTYSDTFDWMPNWMPDRTDLKCEAYCKIEHGNDIEQFHNKQALDKCCVCLSSTTWDNSLEDMYIEFTTALGGSIAVSTDSILNETYYKIAHSDSVMTSLPSNLCNVPYLMVLNFSNNGITSLQGIACAINLDTLDLSKNEIDIVKNTTFARMKNLRIVDLSYNKIAYIEPNVFTSMNARFFSLDLSSNALTTVDVTNMVGLYPYCWVDYQHNYITEVVNENGFTMDLDRSYGPGYIDLKYNLIHTFPDYKTLLLLDDLKMIGKLFDFGIDIRNTPIICDCNMETFLELAEDTIETVWVNHHNITCTGPENHLGRMVSDIPLNELVCHLGVEDGCPLKCSCIDEPSKNTITIECINALLTELPDKLPKSKFSDKIDLNVANNSITEIPSHLDYLYKIDNLNISNNDLTEVTEEVASLLENATVITLTGNDRLNHLPQQFQFKSPCELQLDGIIINCDCNMTWLHNWLSTKTCDNPSLFYCFVDGAGLIDVQEFRKDMLECFTDSEILIKNLVIGLLIALFVTVLTFIIVFIFRYEILVIYVRFITQYLMGKQDVAGMAGIEYHAILSFDECNEHLLNWVLKLRRFLTHNGYHIIIPVVDILHGSRDEEAIKKINKSACVIVVLSDSYANSQCQDDDTESIERPWFENEWKYAWNKCCSRPSKRLILVNYDLLVPGEVANRRMKAYLRVGKVIDFTNTKRNIMYIIKKELGDCSLSPVNTDQNPKPGNDLTLSEVYNDDLVDDSVIAHTRSIEQSERSNNMLKSENPSQIQGLYSTYSREQSKKKMKIPTCSKVAPIQALSSFTARSSLDKGGKAKNKNMNRNSTDTLTKIFQVQKNDKTDSNENMDI